MCEVLRLDIKNPVCVLNQDTARSFLQVSDPHERFEFFMDATKFKELSKLHIQATSRMGEAKSNIARKRGVSIKQHPTC